jgi:capsular polysaccharide biosynthesis protein
MLKVFAKEMLRNLRTNPYAFICQLFLVSIAFTGEKAGKRLFSDSKAIQGINFLEQPHIEGYSSRVSSDLHMNEEGKITFLFVLRNLRSILPKFQSLFPHTLNIINPLNEFNECGIKFHQFSDATLTNLSHVLTKEAVLIRTTPYDLSQYSGLPLRGAAIYNKQLVIPSFTDFTEIDKEVVFFGYSHNSTNYYHFILEVLPRVLQWSKAIFPRKIQFVCDSETPWQLIDLQTSLLNVDALLLPKQLNYRFSKLHVAIDSSIKSLPDFPSPGKENIFLYWKSSILKTRQNLLDFLPHKEPIEAAEYIFVLRPQHGERVPKNQNIVQEILESRWGFFCTDLTSMSISQQIILFSNAKVIVACPGAALTNLMFVQPQAIIILLTARFNKSKLMWPQFASLFDLNVQEVFNQNNRRNPNETFGEINEDGLYLVLDSLLN